MGVGGVGSSVVGNRTEHTIITPSLIRFHRDELARDRGKLIGYMYMPKGRFRRVLACGMPVLTCRYQVYMHTFFFLENQNSLACYIHSLLGGVRTALNLTVNC